MEPTGGETTWTCAAAALEPGQTAKFELLTVARRGDDLVVGA
ncbi:MAG: hypothetical protein ACRELW_15285 [Candidatus Rokuibacteriota bacterium]